MVNYNQDGNKNEKSEGVINNNSIFGKLFFLLLLVSLLGVIVVIVLEEKADMKIQYVIENKLYSNFNNQGEMNIGGLIGKAEEHVKVENSNAISTINTGSVNQNYVKENKSINFEKIKEDANLSFLEKHPLLAGILTSFISSCIFAAVDNKFRKYRAKNTWTMLFIVK